MTDEHLSLNEHYWDERVAPHAASPGYALDRFRDDPGFVSDVVRFDLPRLGDVRGLVGVHLQCHIGTDTISLERLGARMTGLDFSGPAVEQGRRLAAETGAATSFVHGDVYSAPDLLPHGAFDLVFTGVGALCWLPDITRWAQVVATLLRPGGRLFLREGHPVLWSIDDRRTEGLVVDLPYFERPEPTIWTEPGTYVETDHVFAHTTSADWNHGLGEIVTALLAAGLDLTMLVEHDSAPWDPLPGRTEELAGGEHRLAERPWRLPFTYTLQAVRR